MEVKVRIRHSIINKNFHRTIFGGTIFSAIDPYFPINVLANFFSKKITDRSLDKKKAEIKYKNPAENRPNLKFILKEEDIKKALKGLQKDGRFQVWHE